MKFGYRPTIRTHVVYCRGCQRAWVTIEAPPITESPDPILDECECVCDDDTDPLYEAWVVDPPSADIPPRAWER